jgi:hypothetical protein
MSATGWEGILDTGEQIIWQGRPDDRFRWRPRDYLSLVFGIFFAGFALFWMSMAAQAGGFFWMFGLLHFSVGVGIAIGPPFWNLYKRRRSWYTLTERRAIIASDLPILGKKLKSYPITDDTVLEYDSGDPATIYFARETRRGKNGTYNVNIGFERIADGREVYAKLRAIQKEDT